jgi:hypothetical protein
MSVKPRSETGAPRPRRGESIDAYCAAIGQEPPVEGLAIPHKPKLPRFLTHRTMSLFGHFEREVPIKPQPLPEPDYQI